jgi:hypothetical protein
MDCIDRRRPGVWGRLPQVGKRTVLVGLAVLFIAQVVAAAALVARDRADRAAERERLLETQRSEGAWIENLAKPIVRPKTIAGRTATIDPNTRVIGVDLGSGRSRAYRLDAFRHPTGHLVNDMLGETPVSVAYCNLTDCVRVLTDSKRAEPLAIEVAGLRDMQMVLRIQGDLYFQASGEPIKPDGKAPPSPYVRLAPVRTTWRDWLRLHPDTDLYLGYPTRGG